MLEADAMQGASVISSSKFSPRPIVSAFPSRIPILAEKLKTPQAEVPSNRLSSSLSSSSASILSSSASDVVRGFYGGINSHDLVSVEDIIAEKCVYEDLIFAQPFTGRKAILEFFNKFIDYISIDLQFVIDDISEGDSEVVGVMWHLEWKGKPFPFSKGCSFYRLELINGKRQIMTNQYREHRYGRDCVEPALKPGEMALVIIRGLTFLFQKFPKLADLF